MEVIDIGLDDLDNNSSSMNFGGGIELLMNDKKRTSSGSSTKIDLQELDNLENELNALSGVSNDFDNSGPSGSGHSGSGPASESKKISGFSNFFNFGGSSSKKPEPSFL